MLYNSVGNSLAIEHIASRPMQFDAGNSSLRCQRAPTLTTDARRIARSTAHQPVDLSDHPDFEPHATDVIGLCLTSRGAQLPVDVPSGDDSDEEGRAQ
jgi:hypothetical protein